MHHHLSSMVTERQQGRVRLRFSDLMEEEFRQVYAERNYPKIRQILIASAALILVSLSIGVVRATLSWPTAVYMLGITLPVLMATLLQTYKEASYRRSQVLLALTTFLLGLICISLSLRGNLNGASYHFAATVAWVFIVWVVLGLQFRYAAATAVALSCSYLWGQLSWDFPRNELYFSGVSLLAVNIIGGYCCYQLEAAVRQAFHESRLLNELAERDGLTRLYNRRRFDHNVERLWRQSRRDQSQLTLMMVDIDHFKAYNDRYGHQAGDDALVRVAEVIASCAQRPLDFAARYGGEEFAVVLYGPVHDHGRELAEHLRHTVEELKIPHAESPTNPWLTVSIGVAVVNPGTARSLAGAIQLADEALYQAKEEGRNRIVVRDTSSAHIQTGRFRASQSSARA
jgi:diguanylate cyclase (GGDEF)-like protein